MRWKLGGVGAALAVGVLASCGGEAEPIDDNEKSPKAVEAQGPRTIRLSPERIKRGKALYQACSGCHGDKGEGRIGIAPSLTSKSFLEAASDEFLVKTISQGRVETTMAPWGPTIGKDGIEAIVAYLRSLRPTQPADLDNSPLEGDPARGEKLFRDICSTCHGRTGAGYQEAASGTGIGRGHFLLNASNGYLRHVIKNGKSGTPMKSFDEKTRTGVANLKDQEIEDVIAYMRKAAW